MSEPVVAQKGPFAVECESGRKYFWCACGLSQKQPFCDGSHKAVGMAPVMYEATKDGTVFFCGCKASGRKPVCDGSHNKL